MSRTVIAIMAGLLCTLAGCKYAASLRRNASRLRRWVQLLTHLSLLLQEGLPIPQALCAAAQEHQPPDELLRKMAASMQANPLSTPATAYQHTCDDSVEKPTLVRLFAQLGQGTRESRCLALEQAAGELRLMAESAAARAEKDVKLWQTLGFIGGTCLTILLL